MRSGVVPVAIRLAGGLLVASGPAGETWAAGPGCDLAVTVTPAAVAGGARKVQVRVPMGRSDVRILASTGTTGPAQRATTDTVVADFTPEPVSPPLALIAAVGGNQCGFAVVRLSGGQARAPGPVTLVAVEPAAVRADQDAQAQVYVFAADAKGNPRSGLPPKFHTTVGAVTGEQPVGAGAWRARWAVPAIEASAVRLEARFGREPPAATSLERTPGPPAAIGITRDTEPGGIGESASAVLIRVRDSAGNLTDAPLELEADTVKLGSPVRIETGIYRVPVLVLPRNRKQGFAVTARTEGATGQASFSTVDSAAAEIRVAPRGPLRAGAFSQGQLEVIEVAVVDAQGRPVSDPPVGSGGRGQFRDPFPIGPGRWALPYRPPPITEDTTERVTISAGEASTTVELELMVRRISLSAGAKAGWSRSGGTTGLALGAEGGAWARLGRARVGLVLDLGWTMRSRTSTATVGGGGSVDYEATQHDVSIILSVAGRTSFAKLWTVGATLGGGLGGVSYRTSLTGQPSVSEAGFAPLVSGAVSVGPRLGPGTLFLEARMTWTGDPGLKTLTGSHSTFLGLVGYRFDVG